MAATSASAIKQKVESLGLGVAAYRQELPADAAFPCVLIQDGISEQTVRGGDGGAGDTVIENCQLDLLERYLDPVTRTVVESPTLADDLRRGLHGSAPATAGADAPFRIFGFRVPFSKRALDADDNTVRTRMSVDVYRAL